MSDFRYNDILNMQYPDPEIERDFPDRVLRAAQFAPFAALTGYDDAVEETARLTDRKIELDEDSICRINERLLYIMNSEDPEYVSVTYFVPDEKKMGGCYVTKKGEVFKVSEYERIVVMDDGCEIPIDDILSVECKQFNDIEDYEL